MTKRTGATNRLAIGMNNPLKVLLYDIEILQRDLGDAWRTMGAAHSNMISVSFVWLKDYLKKGKRAIKNINLIHTGELDTLDPFSETADKKLVTRFHEILKTADVAVGHYSNQFDWKYVQGKFLKYGLPDLTHLERRDTCMICRRHLKLGGNRLDHVAQFFGVVNKQSIDHKNWMAVYTRSKKALRSIAHYNNGDVETLAEIYLKLEPLWINRQHVGVLNGHTRISCPKCGSEDTHLAKTRATPSGLIRKQLQCYGCGKYFTVASGIYFKEKAKRDEQSN